MGLFGLQFLMSDGSQWEVVNGDQATVRPADSVTPVKFAGTPNVAMLATPDSQYIITLNGSGLAYLYDATQDVYVTSRQLITSSTGGIATTIQGYYGVLGAAAGGSFFLVDGLITDPSLVPIGGSAQPSATTTTNNRRSRRHRPRRRRHHRSSIPATATWRRWRRSAPPLSCA